MSIPYLVIRSIRDIISYYWLARLGVKAAELQSITKSTLREKSLPLSEAVASLHRPLIGSRYLSRNNNMTAGFHGELDLNVLVVFCELQSRRSSTPLLSNPRVECRGSVRPEATHTSLSLPQSSCVAAKFHL